MSASQAFSVPSPSSALPMSIDVSSHPAVRLGIWLRTLRQARGLVKRVFAGQISLSASKYSEVEAGVVRWIHAKQEAAIEEVLDLTREQLRDFRDMLKHARAAVALEFANLFTRGQLTPVRMRSEDGRQVTAKDRELLLHAVFTPLI